MDVALKAFYAVFLKSCLIVSILVLMDVALKVLLNMGLKNLKEVSILVLMDVWIGYNKLDNKYSVMI